MKSLSFVSVILCTLCTLGAEKRAADGDGAEPQESFSVAEVVPRNRRATTRMIHRTLVAEFGSDKTIAISKVKNASTRDAVRIDIRTPESTKKVYYFLQGHFQTWSVQWINPNPNAATRADVDLSSVNTIDREIQSLKDSGLGDTHPRIVALKKIRDSIERDGAGSKK